MALALGACSTEKTEEATTSSEKEAVEVQEVNQPNEQSAEAASEGRFAAYEFESNDYDFGKVDEGTIVEHTFRFKNVGEVPLVVQEAKGSCGCTVPEKPENPIPVGEYGEIKVKFNSQGRTGSQSKTVTLTSNTNPEKMVLKITGVVEGSAQNLKNMKGPVRQ